jgi:hypothetical protein
LARVVIDAAEELDLSPFYGAFEADTPPALNGGSSPPATNLLKLWRHSIAPTPA